MLGGPRASFAYELAINAEKLRYAEHAEETLATEDTTYHQTLFVVTTFRRIMCAVHLKQAADLVNPPILTKEIAV